MSARVILIAGDSPSVAEAMPPDQAARRLRELSLKRGGVPPLNVVSRACVTSPTQLPQVRLRYARTDEQIAGTATTATTDGAH